MNKQNKGITLIALVITIVVLVILVGVSVSVAINTGLIANSKKAVANYDVAQQDEQAEIKKVEDMMNSMNPDSLAAKVKVGDYVKYTPKSGEEYTSYKGDYEGCVDEGEKSELVYQKLTTINVEGEATGSGTQGNGYADQTFTVPADTSNILWRVLSIENGKVNLVSENDIGKNGLWTGEDSDTLYLTGITGYAYGVEELNEICKIYGYGDGAEGARSITVEDVNKITGYDVTKDSEYKDKYGTTHELINGYEWKDSYYRYEYNEAGLNLNTADTSKIPYKLIFEGEVLGFANNWLASRVVYTNSLSFGIRNVGWGVVSDNILTHIDSSETGDNGGGGCYTVRPVVTLKSTVKAGESTTDAKGVTTWEMVVPTES